MRKLTPASPDDAILDCDDMAAAYDALKEPTASELPDLLEKHASRLAGLGHYDIAADVQLASERLSLDGECCLTKSVSVLPGSEADRHPPSETRLDSLQSRLAYEAKCIEHDVSSRSVHAILLEASDAIGILFRR